MLRRDQSRIVKKLSLVYMNILYLKIYRFILLGKICEKKLSNTGLIVKDLCTGNLNETIWV